MKKVEAIVIDERHMELKQPLPKNIGKRIFIQILSKQEERTSQLAELEHAYLTMTENEKKTEVDLAEEGLCGNISDNAYLLRKDELLLILLDNKKFFVYIMMFQKWNYYLES